MNKNLVLYFLLILLIFANFILLDSINTFFIWSLFSIIYIYIAIISAKINPYINKSSLINLALSLLFFLTIIGQFLAIGYYFSKGNYFSYWLDDKEYFETIKTKIDLIDLYSPRVYTTILNSLLYNFLLILKSQITVLDLLVSHWGLSVLICLNSFHIACFFAKRKIPTKLLILGLFTQHIFFYTFLHFYRDTYSILFFSYGIIFLLNKKYLISFVFAVLTSLIRGGQGFLLIAFIFLYLVVNSQHFLFRRSLSFIYLSISIFIIIIVLFSFPEIQTFIAHNSMSISFSNSTKIDAIISIQDYAKERRTTLFVDQGLLDSGKFFSGNPITDFLLSVSYALVQPGNFYWTPFFENNFAIAENGFNTYGLIVSICILSLPLFLSKFILALLYLVRNITIETGFLLIIFIISFCSATFISLIPRHFLIFIIFFPAILGVVPQKYFSINKVFLYSSSFIIFLIFLFQTIKHAI